ncbi:MAG: bZIP transcription factor [Leptospiraceae bacterium]|nr:bZIP transcription factor [Leptospiraceae bacterium]MDW7976478.1 bZIP transcription factor [Leptospiraceae bacterium]
MSKRLVLPLSFLTFFLFLVYLFIFSSIGYFAFEKKRNSIYQLEKQIEELKRENQILQEKLILNENQNQKEFYFYIIKFENINTNSFSETSGKFNSYFFTSQENLFFFAFLLIGIAGYVFILLTLLQKAQK